MTSLIQAISRVRATTTPTPCPYSRAQELILSMLEPVTGIERIFVRQALGRVLAQGCDLAYQCAGQPTTQPWTAMPYVTQTCPPMHRRN